MNNICNFLEDLFKEKGPSAIVLIKPMEIEEYENNEFYEFYIKEIGETIRFRKKTNDQDLTIPLLEINSLNTKTSIPIIYLKGRLIWDTKAGTTGLWVYAPI